MADLEEEILERPGVRSVREALRSAGISGEVRVLPATAPTAAAGHHQTVFSTDFARLVAATSGEVVAVD